MHRLVCADLIRDRTMPRYQLIRDSMARRGTPMLQRCWTVAMRVIVTFIRDFYAVRIFEYSAFWLLNIAQQLLSIHCNPKNQNRLCNIDRFMIFKFILPEMTYSITTILTAGYDVIIWLHIICDRGFLINPVGLGDLRWECSLWRFDGHGPTVQQTND